MSPHGPHVVRRRPRPSSGRWRRRLGALLAAVAATGSLQVALAPASPAATNRIDLRVLVVDDGSNWVRGMAADLDLEGVPYTAVTLSDPARPRLTPDFLASDSQAHYQAVVLPGVLAGSGLATDEASALTAYEARFGIRQVDMFVYPNNAVGMNTPVWAGDLTGTTATVTAAAKSDGFGYLSGNVPFLAGSYGYLATPLTSSSTPALPAGATVTPLLTATAPGTSTTASLVTAYRSPSGVEELVVGAAFMGSLQQFRMLAHGIVSWATRGIHLGHSRNYFTAHFDDALSYDARWSTTDHCTPGEDCPAGTAATPDIRMTAADVSSVVAWQKANGYTITLPFNGYHALYDANGTAWNGTDGLTNAFVANKSQFRWMNHGYQHVYQGCTQDFTVIPWRCQTTPAGQPPAADGSNLVWMPQSEVNGEIATNITVGQQLGLPFDTTEYLSGEHSGLYLTPQQPVDNPNFAAALSQNGIRFIGADASREPAARVVGGATTVPRHPVAVYFNVSTTAEEVSEYNWFYTSRAQGGSGYCEDNPATATCLSAPLSPTTGFTSHIVPTDVANDLRFILSNDPRPFYAHVSNLTGPDYLGLTLLKAVLDTYRGSYAGNSPLVNLTLTQAADVLAKQQAWATAGVAPGAPVTAYLQDGKVTVVNGTSTPAPVTVPEGTTSGGAAFGESYGGERSAWVTGGQTLTVPAGSFSSAAATTFRTGTAGSFTVTVSGFASGTPSITATGALPAGVTFTDHGNRTATLAGTPAAGSGGRYPLTLTATGPDGTVTQAFVLTVEQAPAFTSPAAVATPALKSFSFTVTTSGYPAATITRSGSLPLGVSFTAKSNGTATLSGLPLFNGSYPLTFTARNAAGTATQAFTLVVGGAAPAITSSATATARVGRSFSKTITASGSPAPALTLTGALPAGVTFKPGTGTATLSGTPAAGTSGTYPLTVTATNIFGTVTQALTLTVQQAPVITSPATATATLGQPFSFTVTTTGAPAPKLTETGSLPAGLTWKDNGDGTATVSGTPTSRTTRLLIVTASNGAGSATQLLTVRVS